MNPRIVMLTLTACCCVAGAAAAQQPWIWPWGRGEFDVINVIPNVQSGETNQDSEPFLALNPNNPSELVATAFARRGGLCVGSVAPVFVSSDRGTTWAVACIVPADPGDNRGTRDITVAYATTGNVLYSGILRLPELVGIRLNILSVVSPGALNALMNPLVDRNQPDQPFVQAATVASQDRVFVGHNDFGAAGGRTATVELSQAGSAMRPAFTTARIERRATVGGQNGPAIRPAVHADSTVYAAYYGIWRRNGNIRDVDVVVVRDDSLGASAQPFSALVDAADGIAGNRVRQNISLRWNTAGVFGQERLGTYLSIAVHPNNSDEVWLAWVDTGTVNVPTLHVRHSTDRGVTWDANDLRTVASAINPGLAITTGGEVGFMYQELATVGANQRWITHFERTTNSFTTIRDDTLATVLANQPAQAGTPYLGDYIHLLTNGRTFYGVFAAGNRPDNANFPSGVTYQRNANFTTNQLLDATGNVVAESIDPFFFRARTPRIIDWCDLRPGRCIVPDFGRDVVRWRCLTEPCVVIDPIDRNCLYKWSCPGCEGALCPGLYEITLEGLGPEWHVTLVDPAGEPYAHQLERTRDRAILRFSPQREDFRGRDIGEYRLVFAADSGTVQRGAEFQVRARLNVTAAPERGRKPPLR